MERNLKEKKDSEREEERRGGRGGEMLKILPVFSLISHRTLNSAGFMRWQLRVCFLHYPKIETNGEKMSMSVGLHPSLYFSD